MENGTTTGRYKLSARGQLAGTQENPGEGDKNELREGKDAQEGRATCVTATKCGRAFPPRIPRRSRAHSAEPCNIGNYIFAGLVEPRGPCLPVPRNLQRPGLFFLVLSAVGSCALRSTRDGDAREVVAARDAGRTIPLCGLGLATRLTMRCAGAICLRDLRTEHGTDAHGTGVGSTEGIRVGLHTSGALSARRGSTVDVQA